MRVPLEEHRALACDFEPQQGRRAVEENQIDLAAGGPRQPDGECRQPVGVWSQHADIEVAGGARRASRGRAEHHGQIDGRVVGDGPGDRPHWIHVVILTA